MIAGLLHPPAAAQPTANLLGNGGFEDGEAAWMWEQWDARPLPGFVDRDQMVEGLASFAMSLPDGQGTRYMAAEATGVDPTRPHVLSFQLKTRDVPPGAVRARLQIPGRGWLPGIQQRPELVVTGGTQDWTQYVFPITAEQLGNADKLTVFFYHDAIDRGTLSIDDVVIRPQGPVEQVERVNPSADQPSAPADGADAQTDGLVNGGFEQGHSGWMYEQWDNKPLPGEVVHDSAPQGGAYFRMSQPDATEGRWMAREISIPDPSQDWRIDYRLRTRDVPADAARVRLQVPTRGWLHTAERYPDQLTTGGTQDWQSYSIDLSSDALVGQDTVTLYFYHDQPQTGSVGIDDVQLVPADAPAPAAATGQSDARAAPARGELNAASFDIAQPGVLLRRSDAAVAVRIEPARAIYRPGDLQQVTIERSAGAAGELVWQMLDGFGETVDRGRADGDAASVSVPPPQDPGYYEVVAQLTQGQTVRAETRRSFGVFPPAPQPTGEEPFGLWIQGQDHYEDLGVTWTREGLYYPSMAMDPEGYIQAHRRRFDNFRDQGIRVLAYPKGQPTEFRIGRELMQDTPEAWAALEAHWTTIVRGLAGHVDAWGVINEPMSTFWEGDDQMIIKYWTLMRRIVDRYDPDTPLLGPSLNPLTPRHVAQYQNLLNMGFGELIDGIEVHTYTPSPEDNGFLEANERFVEMTREATGRTLPVWVTEMGISATHPQELDQAQFAARSLLLVKRGGYPQVIWHMFSWPQGEDLREVNFANWRDFRDPDDDDPPQPRPAGVAFATAISELTNATYRTTLDHLGPSINAYVFERDGEAMVAVWTTSARTYDVQLAVDQPSVEQTDLFGRTTRLEATDGTVDVHVTRSPVYLSPMPAFYLDAQPPLRVSDPVVLLPGESAGATLQVTNPRQREATLRVQWLDRQGWSVQADTSRWTLPAGGQTEASIRIDSPADAPLGPRQVYGRLYIDDQYAGAAAVPVEVSAAVRIVSVRPAVTEAGEARVEARLRRQNPQLQRATLRLQGGAQQDVTFDGEGDELVAGIPWPEASRTQLQAVEVVAQADGVQDDQTLRLSVVPVGPGEAPPTIDPQTPGVLRVGDREPVHLAWAWSGDHVYLTVDVHDPDHHQQMPPHNAWQQDSIQIGIAPGDSDQLLRPPNTGLQEAEYVELLASLDETGQARLHRERTVNQHAAPPGSIDPQDLPMQVTREGQTTSYRLSIPVGQLGMRSLQPGDVLRAAVLVNDADEQGGGIERHTRPWFEGIATSKDPADFGHLVLTPTPR
jgi:hypothetical protein